MNGGDIELFLALIERKKKEEQRKKLLNEGIKANKKKEKLRKMIQD